MIPQHLIYVPPNIVNNSSQNTGVDSCLASAKLCSVDPSYSPLFELGQDTVKLEKEVSPCVIVIDPVN
ncbi:hypothetical protein RYX36_012616 [Vicia faba]